MVKKDLGGAEGRKVVSLPVYILAAISEEQIGSHFFSYKNSVRLYKDSPKKKYKVIIRLLGRYKGSTECTQTYRDRWNPH